MTGFETMPLDQHEKPGGKGSPAVAVLIVAVAASAVFAAVAILKFLTDVPVAVRFMIAAGDLLITCLGCWLLVRLARR